MINCALNEISKYVYLLVCLFYIEWKIDALVDRTGERGYMINGLCKMRDSQH